MKKPPASEVLSVGFWALTSTYETRYQRAGAINQPRFLRVAWVQLYIQRQTSILIAFHVSEQSQTLIIGAGVMQKYLSFISSL
jgi:hypothetical protein